MSCLMLWYMLMQKKKKKWLFREEKKERQCLGIIRGGKHQRCISIRHCSCWIALSGEEIFTIREGGNQSVVRDLKRSSST